MANLRDFLPRLSFGRAERKAVDFGDLFSGMMQPLGQASYQTGRSFSNVVSLGYSSNPYVFRAVRTIAQGVSGIPWLLYQDRMSQDKGKTVDGHHSLLLLNIQANPTQAASTFWQYLVSDMLLAGDGWVYANRNGRGIPGELYTLRPDLVKPVYDNASGKLLRYEYGYGNQKQDYAPEDVLHIPEINPLRGMGIGPARVAGRSVDQMTAADDWNTALLQNMAQPGGMLSPDASGPEGGFIPPDERDRIEKLFREKYSGPKNAGRTFVPGGPMKWQAMGNAPAEMEWLEGKEHALRQIATAFGIAPELLGDAAGKTYANMAEARASLYTETIFPLLDTLSAALTMWLAPMYALDPLHYSYYYDRDAVEAIQEDRGQVWDRASAASFLTINEKRQMVGLEDIGADGDVILVPNTMTPLEQAIEPPAQPPQLHMITGGGQGNQTQAGSGATGDDQPQNDQATGTDGKSVMRPFSSAPGSARRQPGALKNARISARTMTR